MIQFTDMISDTIGKFRSTFISLSNLTIFVYVENNLGFSADMVYENLKQKRIQNILFAKDISQSGRLGVWKSASRSDQYLIGLAEALSTHEIMLHKQIFTVNKREKIDSLIIKLENEMTDRRFRGYDAVYNTMKQRGTIKNDLLITVEMFKFFVSLFIRSTHKTRFAGKTPRIIDFTD